MANALRTHLEFSALPGASVPPPPRWPKESASDQFDLAIKAAFYLELGSKSGKIAGFIESGHDCGLTAVGPQQQIALQRLKQIHCAAAIAPGVLTAAAMAARDNKVLAN